MPAGKIMRATVRRRTWTTWTGTWEMSTDGNRRVEMTRFSSHVNNSEMNETLALVGNDTTTTPFLCFINNYPIFP